MKEQCEKCQKFDRCYKKEEAMKLRKELARLEEKKLCHGISGIIHFHCDYFRMIEPES